MKDSDKINFGKNADLLIPVIIQDERSLKVLMLGYMNQEALERTMEEGCVYFWSRSKKRLWKKGETSGNQLIVKKIMSDCDKDAVLILVNLLGKAVCHTGGLSCFFHDLVKK